MQKLPIYVSSLPARNLLLKPNGTSAAPVQGAQMGY